MSIDETAAADAGTRAAAHGRTRFRPASAGESDLLADLVMGDPEQEMTRVAMRLYGLDRIDDARKIFRAAWRAGENWRTSTLAVVDDEIVGVLQTGRSSMRVSAGLVLTLLTTLGPAKLFRLPGRLRLQERVSPKKPADAYVISELHVASHLRGRGYGAEMLAYAEDDARRQGFRQMALHTLTTNPARHLYERFGFEVAETRTDPAFHRLTGAEGNVLMVKRLTGD